MKKVAYISDDLFANHETGASHPESKERIFAIEKAIKTIEDSLIYLKPIEASKEHLLMIHSKEQIEMVENFSEEGRSIDLDTVCSLASYKVALSAVGAGIVALDSIKKGNTDRVFCGVRPPGHHSTPTTSMGFCLFNNIAISARYAQKLGYEKVMIIDFDVHHGNGTQDAFFEDDTVFYFSSHQSFSYPGTGAETHVGTGDGEGYTANFLLMPDSGDGEILDIYMNDLPPIVANFKPDIILVSAGYDLHESDPLAQLDVTTYGIRRVVRCILDSYDVPSVFFLEGGYDLEALGTNVKVTLDEMLR